MEHKDWLSLPKDISFSQEQLGEITKFSQSLADERIPTQLKRAIVFMAFALDQEQDDYQPVTTHSGIMTAFNALLEDLSLLEPENDDEYLSIVGILLENSFLKMKNGDLNVDKFMQAIESVNKIY